MFNLVVIANIPDAVIVVIDRYVSHMDGKGVPREKAALFPFCKVPYNSFFILSFGVIACKENKRIRAVAKLNVQDHRFSSFTNTQE